jgi:hypothetical protein
MSILLGHESCMPSSLSSQHKKRGQLDTNASNTQGCIQKSSTSLVCIAAVAIRIKWLAGQQLWSRKPLTREAPLNGINGFTTNHRRLAKGTTQRSGGTALSMKGFTSALLISDRDTPRASFSKMLNGVISGF